jgi:hypothetical protein
MASSGIRIGAWDFLKWKHITPHKDANGEIVASKLTIYAGGTRGILHLHNARGIQCSFRMDKFQSDIWRKDNWRIMGDA